MQVSRESRARGGGSGIAREAPDEDVEEEEVGGREGVGEKTGMADGVEVRELVGELGDGEEVGGVEAREDELGEGLVEVGDGGGSVDENEDQVSVNGYQSSCDHLWLLLVLVLDCFWIRRERFIASCTLAGCGIGGENKIKRFPFYLCPSNATTQNLKLA